MSPFQKLRDATDSMRAGLALAFAAAGLLVAPGVALAAGSPDITLSAGAAAQSLYGSSATVTLTAANPAGKPYGYNLSFRAVLPKGV
ncbi:MAG TPA: hypothetical protein VKU89_03345 [Solirubrobacteraceae bacterium]|nr:hypothetical protein [Solirubrobacteraceae bacterium]